MMVLTCGAAVLQVDNVLMSARNIEKLEVNFASAVRVYDVLRADKIVIEEEALAYLNVSRDPCLQYMVYTIATLFAQLLRLLALLQSEHGSLTVLPSLCRSFTLESHGRLRHLQDVVWIALCCPLCQQQRIMWVANEQHSSSRLQHRIAT